VVYVAVKSESLSWRLQRASRVFAASVLLSLIGMSVELAVFVVASSLILLTDLFHWAVDTVLEVVFLATLVVASKTRRRFPWSIIAVESSLTTLSCIAILGVYFYVFADYLFSLSESASVTTQEYTPLVATVSGGVLTVLAYSILSRAYRKYRIELLRVDSIHALVDTVAALMASLGVVLVVRTGSTAVELFFTFILMLFVFHSMIEVFKNNIKAFTGGQLDAELASRIAQRVKSELDKNASLLGVEARKLGSFYVVNVELEVDPDTTVLELHRLRERVVKTVLGVSELIYHVDVKYKPKYKRRVRRARRGLNSKRNR